MQADNKNAEKPHILLKLLCLITDIQGKLPHESELME